MAPTELAAASLATQAPGIATKGKREGRRHAAKRSHPCSQGHPERADLRSVATSRSVTDRQLTHVPTITTYLCARCRCPAGVALDSSGARPAYQVGEPGRR